MIKRKKKPGLKSNPALPLIGFKTTTKTEDDDHVDVHYRKRLEVNGTHLHLYLFVDRSADQTRGMLKRTEPFLDSASSDTTFHFLRTLLNGN